jgi:hypothetical protein
MIMCLFEGKPTDYTYDLMNNPANTSRKIYSNKQLTVIVKDFFDFF